MPGAGCPDLEQRGGPFVFGIARGPQQRKGGPAGPAMNCETYGG